jgi:hypothetical protein
MMNSKDFPTYHGTKEFLSFQHLKPYLGLFKNQLTNLVLKFYLKLNHNQND